MPYSTQFHFVVPSPGSVVISTANSRVPVGALDHCSASVEAAPSQVYAAGNAPPFGTVALATVNSVLVPPALGFTVTADDSPPAPLALLADTVHVYVVSFASPVTVIGLPLLMPFFDTPAATQVAVYDKIADPPFEAGAVNAMFAVRLPGVATTLLGAPGTVMVTIGVLTVALSLPQAVTTVAVTTHHVRAARTVRMRMLWGVGW